MMNIQKMMKQAQEMQFKMQEMQEKLNDLEVTGESGGGLVKVVMSCQGNVRALDIDESIMNDKDMAEDLIVAAINNANAAKDAKIKEETASMMSGMGLPEGTQLPF